MLLFPLFAALYFLLGLFDHPALAQEHAHVPTPIDGDAAYHLALDEEFTSSGIPVGWCSTGWGACSGVSIPYNAIENNCYDSERQSIPGDGYLHLSSAVSSCTAGGKSYSYISGTIRTSGFKVGEGYIEVRAKIPNFSGMIPNWPAIWLVGQNWPAGGEIDIFEGMGGHAFATYHSSQHPGGISTGPGGDWTGWHVFAALWKPTEITYYYDGVQVGRVTSAQTPIATNWMTLILNMAMGGEGGPQVPSAVMKVDYVHWYSKSPNTPTVTPKPGYGGIGDNGLQVCQ